MRCEVENGLGELEVVVTAEMTAQLDGKEIHAVYSTFWAAKHAETAARRAIEPFFEGSDNAVGSELTINHVRMAAVGTTLLITARVASVDKQRITCVYEIRDSKTGMLIANGRQVQVVLQQQQINALVSAAYGN